MSADSWTDEELIKIENHLRAEFKSAQKEIKAKSEAYFEKFFKMDKIKAKQVEDGTLSQEEYNQWRHNKIMYGEHWHNLVDQITKELLNVNKTALDYINGKVPQIYAVNFNSIAEVIENSPVEGYSFELVNADTVKNLEGQEDIMLPPPKDIDAIKDIAWNAKKVNSVVMQGILQGSNMKEIADKLAVAVCESNEKAAIRNARTMVTAAENSGRQSGMNRAEASGIIFKKRWIATNDSRTRPSHMAQHGELVNNGEKFSNGLMFPGDWSVNLPHEIYNCRCTLGSWVTGFVPKANIQDVHGKYQGYKINAIKKELKAVNEELSAALHHVLKAEGAPGQLWLDYVNDDLDPVTTAKVNAILMEYEASNPAQQLLAMAEQLEKLDEDNFFENIWKDPVTASDYPMKKDKIALKKQYFEEQLDKYNTYDLPDSEEKIKFFESKLQELENFEKAGKEYEKLYNEYHALDKQIHSLVKDATKNAKFLPEMYTTEAKENAMFYYDRSDADKALRPYLDSIWDNLEEKEKYAVWEYTHNSNPMNKSLSGYHDDWYRSSFIGMANTDWNHENSWRRLPDEFHKFGENGKVVYHKVITDCTNAIQKSEIQESMVLVRASGKEGLAGLIEGDIFSFDDANEIIKSGDVKQMKKAFVGQEFQNHAFTSTAIAQGSGFSGDVTYEIYAPKGTHGIYAEPQSYFGNTVGQSAKLYKVGQRYFSTSSEAEIIVQRGTTYKITDIEKNGSHIHVKMDIVNQPDYFKYGDEDTYNNGKTRHKN